MSRSEHDKPEIYAIRRSGAGWKLSRRDLAGVAAAAASAAAPRPVQAQQCDKTISHENVINVLAITPDGRTLISGSEDRTIKFWRLPQGAHYKTIKHSQPVSALAVSPNGRLLLTGASGLSHNLHAWSLPEGDPVADWGKHATNALAFTPDGRFFAAADNFGVTTLRSSEDGRIVRKMSSSAVRAVISPDGELLLTGVTSLEIHALPEAQRMKSLSGHSRTVWALAVAPEGKLLASAGDDQTIRLWSLPDGRALKTLTGHESFIRGLAITPDGRLLVSASWDKTVRLWSLPEGEPLAMLEGHTANVNAVAISPDGKLLASAGADKTIRLWSLPDGTPVNPCLVDLTVTPSEASGVRYTIGGATYTLPCGAPIPAGAVCVCNCVPGAVCSCVSYTCGCVSYTCSCVGACGCVSYSSHYWYPN